MKKDIILAGVGGQGILSIAAVIGMAALNSGLQLKQAEVHGMSQRGGDVHSNLRIADHEIFSDLIPYGKADLIISVEPMESLRYLPWLSKEGWLISNNVPHVNIPDYPDMEQVDAAIEAVSHHVLINADQVARDLGMARSANMVILGAASPWLGINYDEIENAVRNIFLSKGPDVVDQNLKALAAGREFAVTHHS
ncbi:MAG: indolepyruvate oxidoreductase subunit beta [Bacteroidales bacterium]|jgi:indolepyruvate ferredoxin oxidoreductase beta subunit|nr:indolepyruvate oxidoreductase subunit beta [Bacteroidales bacterium]